MFIQILTLILLLPSFVLAQGYTQKATIGFNGAIESSYALSYTLNAANLKFDVGFSPPTTCTITHVAFYKHAVTGSPTATIRIETDSSGRASGTLVATNTSATGVAISGTGWLAETALTANATTSPGTLYHMVISNDHGTPASNHFAPRDQSARQAGIQGTSYRPYEFYTAWTASYDGAAWANRNGPIMVFVCNEGFRWGQVAHTSTIATMSSSTWKGMRFTARVSGTVFGMNFSQLPNTGTGTITARLYDTADNLLGTATLSANWYTIRGNARHSVFMAFASPPTITAGSDYRIVWSDSGSADRMEFTTISASSPDYSLIDPLMAEWKYTEGSTGSWTDTAGQSLNSFALFLSDITTSSGGANAFIGN